MIEVVRRNIQVPLRRRSWAFMGLAWRVLVTFPPDENPETFKKYFLPALLDAAERTS